MLRCNFTCPIIDDKIEDIEDEIYYILSKANPNFNDMEEFQKYDKVKEFYEEHFKKHIEELRDTNSKLRDCAESKIEELLSEIEELRIENERLKDEIDRLSDGSN
jgi:predicted nuclease with TOPRIM domain